MDSKQFSNCNSILEVYTLAKKLKEQGEDESEVNRLATVRKRELVARANEVSSLKKVVVKPALVGLGQVTKFPIKVNNLNSGHIIITSDNVVEL